MYFGLVSSLVIFLLVGVSNLSLKKEIKKIQRKFMENSYLDISTDLLVSLSNVITFFCNIPFLYTCFDSITSKTKTLTPCYHK